jgi:hypothetical protein
MGLRVLLLLQQPAAAGGLLGPLGLLLLLVQGQLGVLLLLKWMALLLLPPLVGAQARAACLHSTHRQKLQGFNVGLGLQPGAAQAVVRVCNAAAGGAGAAGVAQHHGPALNCCQAQVHAWSP